MPLVADEHKGASLDSLSGAIDRVIYANAESTSYSDADTLVSGGGDKLADRSVSAGEFSKNDGDTDGRKLTLAEGTFVADEGGDVSHAIYVDDNASAIEATAPVDDGTGSPLSVAGGIEYSHRAHDLLEVGDPTTV